MEVKYAVHPDDAVSFDTQRLREEFSTHGLMQPDTVRMVYTHYDRFIYGGIAPARKALTLDTCDELKSAYFLERRELGALNVGGPGTVTVDGETYEMKNLDMLYIGRGKRTLVFASADANDPAKFYINSCPAHREYPPVKNTRAQANRVELGAQEFSNKRTIFQYIHEDGIQSCQLVMGFTELAKGNIWNTFPPHTHERRMEAYFYFDLPEDQIVVHFMGRPRESRHLALQNYDVALSPPWSIHAGAGTAAYKFVWGMGGENKAFSDMDGVDLKNFR